MSKSTTLTFVVLLGLLLCLSAPAQAQFAISGTVTGPLAQPLPNVSIILYDDQGGNPIPWTVTDSTGFYTISGLPAATYGVGFEPSCSSFLLPHFEPTVVVSGNVTLNAFIQQGLVISGFARDTFNLGIPAIDMNVYDQATGDKLTLCNDNTDSVGFYAVAIPAGTYRLRWRSTTGDPWVPVELENVVVTGDTTINIRMLWGVIVSGLVTDQFAQPVVDADLDFADSFTGQKIVTPGDNTDGAGIYEVIVPAGTFDIDVEPQVIDRLVAGQLFGVPISNDTTINFVLDPGLSLSGTLRDPGGIGVFNVDIDVKDSNTGFKLLTPWDKTDASGNYEIIVPSGLFDIAYQPPVITGLAPIKYLDVAITGDTIVNATLPNGITLSGVIENSFAVPVAGVDIDVENAATGEKMPLVGDNTDSLGAFAVVTVPGIYNLQFEPPKQRRLAAEEFPIVSLSQDTSVFVTLDTGRSVSGTVSDSTGAALVNVQVDAIKSSTGDTVFTPANKTDTAGFYEIIVRPNTYDLAYVPDSLSGIPDPIVFTNTAINSDTVINVTFSASVNQPPVLAPIGNKTTTEGVLLTFGVSATDAESIPALTTSTRPSGASFTDHGNGAGTFSWTPGITQSGSYNLTFYATDDSAAVDSEQIIITVIPSGGGNQPPVLAPIGNKTTTEGVPLTFGVSATDAESTPALTTSTRPPGASFTDHGNGTGTFSWTPDLTQAGSYNLTFYATDDSAAVDSEQIIITVNESGGGDQPPVLAPIGNRLATAAETLIIQISATDAEGPPVLSTSNPLPGGALFVDSGNGNGSFVWTPDSTQVGNNQVTFYAQDTAHQIDFETVSILVSLGGVCCIGIRGDINSLGGVDVADLGYLVDYLFRGGPPPLCTEEADVDASGGVDVSDLGYIVDYLFRGGPPPVACP